MTKTRKNASRSFQSMFSQLVMDDQENLSVGDGDLFDQENQLLSLNYQPLELFLCSKGKFQKWFFFLWRGFLRLFLREWKKETKTNPLKNFKKKMKHFASIREANKIVISRLLVVMSTLAMRGLDKTRPDTRLPQSRAGGQGPYSRSFDHLGFQRQRLACQRESKLKIVNE